ncbi:hypothetical protein BDN67DRAFT_895384, partial [Paxillus ammoniavirescens]
DVALLAARPVSDYATAVRTLGAIKENVEIKKTSVRIDGHLPVHLPWGLLNQPQ